MKQNYWKGFGSGIAVAAFGIIALGGLVGFQGTSAKVGVVDSRKVISSSDLYRRSRETFQSATSTRQSILEFVLELQNPPSADEQKALEEFRNRQASTGDLLQEWQKEFQQELEQLDSKVGQDLEKNVRDAIQEVGKKQGYSVVYASTVAPYAANDITDEVVKAVNKTK